MSSTHNFVSAISDGADATLVRPSNWNAAHDGLQDDDGSPSVDQVVRPNHCAQLVGGTPLILASGRLMDIQAGGVLVLSI